ncbi:MAG: DUF885 domain-containing protein [Armatimonadetes bacterium]|nr:DUF885 domain-containing protein [Armatimonadota bacterium]
MPSVQDPPAVLDQLIQDYFETDHEYFPTQATALGLPGHDHRLEILSEERIQELVGKLKGFQRRLESIAAESLPLPQEVEHRYLRSLLSAALRDFEKEKNHRKDPCLYPDAAFHSLLSLILWKSEPRDVMLENVASRLRQFPLLLDSGIRQLQNPPPLFTSQAAESIRQGEVIFDEMIPQLLETASPGLRKLVLDSVAEGKEAMLRYLEFVEKELAPRSSGDYAVGKEAFDERLRNNHFLTVDAQELLETGKEIFAKYEVQMNALARELGENRWLSVILANKKNHPEAANLIQTYSREVADARAFVLQKNLVSIPVPETVEVIETPAFHRLITPLAAFLPPGPFQKAQKGFFLVTPVDNQAPMEAQAAHLLEHNIHKIRLNSVHEAYPGHHLQFVFCSTLDSDLRKRARNTLYVEGWAIYCETLMGELGYFNEPVSQLFLMKDQIWRAARVILDVGLQTGTLSYDDAVSWLHDKIGFGVPSARAEVNRYCRMPTQPLSYTIGKMEIEKLRDDYRKARGPDFSLKEFHDSFLACGAVPIALARTLMLGNHKREGSHS